MTAKNHVRSISLPSRSHPTTVEIEQELNKLRTLEPSSSSSLSASEALCSGLAGLEDLYRCTEDLLKKASTVKILSQNQGPKFVDEFLDGAVRLMDVCSAGKDFLSEINQHVRNLQSVVRRRKTESSVQSVVANYTSFRKNMNKEVKKLIFSLKQTEIKIRVSQAKDQEHHHLTAVVYVLREVDAFSVSVLKSLMSFLSPPVLTRCSSSSKWSIVSKLLMKGEEEKKQKNEIEIVDCAIQRYQDCLELLKKLEDLETGVQKIETRLESVFRWLVRTRATLLNIVSHK